MSSPKNKPYSGKNISGPGSSSPYPTQRLSAPISLVDTARQIEAASERVAERTNAELELIARQIQRLQEDARGILARAQNDLELHQAECSFERVPGKVYHLYRKGDGRTRFSMLSPQDYGGAPPYEFVGSYRLERDQSWTAEHEIEARAQERQALRTVLAIATERTLPSGRETKKS